MTKLQSMTYKILNLMKTLPLFILISLYILFSLMHHKSCRTSHELLSHQQLKYLPQAALKQHKSIFPFWIRQIMQKSEICPGITRTLKWQHKYWTITKPSRDGVKKDWGESGPGSAGLQWGCTHPKVLPFGVDKVYCKTCLCLRQTCPGPHGKLQGWRTEIIPADKRSTQEHH